MSTSHDLSPAPKQTQQTQDDIQTITDLEHIRLRPGMYIGVQPDLIYNLINNVLDYPIDEAMAGRCYHVDITIHAGSSITISDNGSGLPVAMNPREHLSALEVELTVTFCGRRPSDGSYHVTGGMHGVKCALRVADCRGSTRWLRLASDL